MWDTAAHTHVRRRARPIASRCSPRRQKVTQPIGSSGYRGGPRLREVSPGRGGVGVGDGVDQCQGREAVRWLRYALAVPFVLILLLAGWLWLFSDWDAQRHDRLTAETAQPIAARELLRVARKRGEVRPDDALLGEPCLVSLQETPHNKHYVFEFRRNQATPRVVSVYVDSSPAQLDYELTSNAETRADGTTNLDSPVAHCGRPT